MYPFLIKDIQCGHNQKNTDTEEKKEILKILNPKIRKNTEILNKKIQILNKYFFI